MGTLQLLCPRGFLPPSVPSPVGLGAATARPWGQGMSVSGSPTVAVPGISFSTCSSPALEQ